jgi:hypothetical protein
MNWVPSCLKQNNFPWIAVVTVEVTDVVPEFDSVDVAVDVTVDVIGGVVIVLVCVDVAVALAVVVAVL